MNIFPANFQQLFPSKRVILDAQSFRYRRQHNFGNAQRVAFSTDVEHAHFDNINDWHYTDGPSVLIVSGTFGEYASDRHTIVGL